MLDSIGNYQQAHTHTHTHTHTHNTHTHTHTQTHIHMDGRMWNWSALYPRLAYSTGCGIKKEQGAI